jgi:hypothetical protein
MLFSSPVGIRVGDESLVGGTSLFCLKTVDGLVDGVLEVSSEMEKSR